MFVKESRQRGSELMEIGVESCGGCGIQARRKNITREVSSINGFEKSNKFGDARRARMSRDSKCG